MSHIFFIHSSVDRQLGHFHILAIVNKIVNHAAMNIGVHISFQLVFSFSSDKYPGVELLGHVYTLYSAVCQLYLDKTRRKNKNK